MTSQPGFSVYAANLMLAALPNTVYVKQHVGPPGAAGTANPSAVTTRQSATLGAASGGVRSLTTSPVFTETATETETWVSFWDTVGPTGGNFLVAGILTTPQAEQSGYTFTLNVGTIDLTNLLAS